MQTKHIFIKVAAAALICFNSLKSFNQVRNVVKQLYETENIW